MDCFWLRVLLSTFSTTISTLDELPITLGHHVGTALVHMLGRNTADQTLAWSKLLGKTIVPKGCSNHQPINNFLAALYMSLGTSTRPTGRAPSPNNPLVLV